jgi:hypothetical protein
VWTFFYIIDQNCGLNQSCIDERKVLISKKGLGGDTYPSEFQEAVTPPKDKKILIKGLVTDSQGNAIPSRDVYLRVNDPPDSSPYISSPSSDDNIDKTGANGGTLTGCLTTNPCKVKSDSQGKFQATLEVISGLECTDKDHIPCAPSGDNYQVEGSFTSDFVCGPTCGGTKTGVITAWKRIYVERDKMFRQGSLLKLDALANSNVVVVRNFGAENTLPTCDNNPQGPSCYQISIFDSKSPYEAPTSEKPYVGWVTNDVNGDFELHLVKADSTTYTLSKSYYYSPYPAFGEDGINPRIIGNSAGVGVIGSGFYELSTNYDLVMNAFKEAYVELKLSSPVAGAIPYVPPTFFNETGQNATTYNLRFGRHWYNNCFYIDQDWACADNNYFHLMGIKAEPNPFILGRSYHNSLASLAYNFIASNEQDCPNEPEKDRCKQNTEAHEFAHQFAVNVCSGIQGGHCDQLAWCSTPLLQSYCGNSTTVDCIMKPTDHTQRGDGIEHFDIHELFLATCPYQPDSIRLATDPQ